MARPTSAKVGAALRDAARVAAVMVDGDLAGRIVSARSWHYIRNPNPKYRFMTGDYFDVDHASFLLMKKTLLRLGRLTGFTCGTSLWLPVPGVKGQVTCAVQNGKLHRYYRFGASSQPAAPEMLRCLRTGKVLLAPPHRDFVTALAPVRDSLGDVVGVVELCSPSPKSKALAPAWS
jgi:hypothetical protein